MGNRALIIGGGIAGLSAASYLQRNGFETEIFEAHERTGGLCTGWRRQGFTFDGCIHWLMGSGPSSNMHELWRELGAGDLRYIEWERYTVAHLRDGDAFSVWTDPARLEAELLRLSPEDGVLARRIAAGVRAASRFDMPAAMDKLGLGGMLGMIAALPGALTRLLPWAKRPVSELIAGAKGPRLREAFVALLGESIDSFPAIALFLMLGFMHKRSSGYPIGGSLAFVDTIEAKYRALGGKVRCKSRVDEIMVEGGRAVGLRGAWGEARGDWIIGAADAHDTLERLLGGRFQHAELDAGFAEAEAESAAPSVAAPSLPTAKPEKAPGALVPFPSLLYLSFGLSKTWKDEPSMQSFPLATPLVFEDGALSVDSLNLRLFHFDSSMAPEGKTVGIVMLESRGLGYWSSLRDRDRGAYAKAKDTVAHAVLAALDDRIPGFQATAEVIDVSTPATFVRYTGNWRGSFEGWLPVAGSLGTRLADTVPGLEGYRMIGQWMNPGGGLPPCAIQGRNLAKALCKIEGRRFKAD